MSISGVTYFRAAELALSIMGLTFSLLSHNMPLMLLISYALSTIYVVILLLCQLAGRAVISLTIQGIIEVVLAVIIIIFTIIAISGGDSKDVWHILVFIVGFLLPCLFLITAYDKF